MRNEYDKKCSADVIIAALNEEEGIGLTLAEISQKISPNQVLVVDGHSHDRTVEIAKDMGAHVLFQDGIGKGDAISKAVRYIDSDADYVVVTDADFTYPAEHIPEMIQILENHPDVGMVCGNRFNDCAEESAVHNLFYFGNKLLAFSHSLLNGVNLRDPLTGLRAIRAEILKEWQVKSKGFDIEVELNSEVERRDFGIVEVPIGYRKRLGEKKLKVSDGATIFKRILLESTHQYWLNQVRMLQS
ncbi:MAG: glycosyltransferase family 2 protein [Candidatus Bathyarchaeia archaeon]